MDISNGHQGPLDDEPLFVPDGFEAEHLDEARRTIAKNLGTRRLARRVASSIAGQRGNAPQQRVIRLITMLHGIAVLVTIALSAVTDTWLIGLAVTAMVGLSLLAAIRLVHVIERAHAYELAQRQQPQQRRG